ncbi:MAG: glycosyl hydrolase, partial [Acidobacteria bacterium]|nr:glycosyl hydrolase [Acidobacteriota bacterium]
TYRSADRGATWERRNEYDTTAMYYGKIFVDPKDADRIYVMNVNIMTSDEGGRNLRALGSRSKHVDNHAMWIDPANTDHLLVGCDGGLYDSFDRGETWRFYTNLPITQFYAVTVDTAAPFYNVYGGTQDNYSLGGPGRNRNSVLSNYDWFVTQGGDGFRSVVDPVDPNIVYAESQHGGLVRFDRRTGERLGIQPQEGKGEMSYRWNWDSPILISPHAHTRLYFAANKLFRSDDRGDTWKAISGELSREIDRNKLPVMGKVWGPDAIAKNASTSLYGNVTALTESPKKEGLIYAGTDDGLIHVTEDGGKNWRKIEKFAGVPDNTFVSRLLTSQHDVNTVFAAFDNHKNSDFAPYLLKSTDNGKTWASIKGDLPANGPVYAIAEDHVDPNLLFAGTEFGLFFSTDSGQKWIRLRGGFPTIAVKDLAIQKQMNDLAVASFGRGFYILDDYTPLRGWKPEVFQKDSVIFPVRDALMFIQATPVGGRGKGFQGETFFTAENPPVGATFTYFLKDALRTKRQRRQEAERAAARRNEAPRYPTADELRAEEEEEPPAVIVTITDSTGRVVRRLNGSATPGIQRITWDLREPAVGLGGPGGGGPGGGGGGAAGGAGAGAFQQPGGPLVMPGTYKVSLAKRVDGVLTPFAGEQSFNVVVEGQSSMKPEDRAALHAFQQKVVKLQRAVSGTLDIANTTRTRLGLIKRAIQETPALDQKLRDQANALDAQLNSILRALRGDVALRQRNENTMPAISERVGGIAGDQRMSISRPTQTHLDAYAIAAQEFAAELAKLRALVETDLVKLEKALEAAGAPYTPGRLPDWKDQ